MDDVLSRVGIGNATVDLRIPQTVQQGETVNGTLHITGGDAPQDVETVYAALRSEHRNPGDGGLTPYTVDRYTLIDEPFTIQPDEETTREVTLTIPKDAPVTTIDTVEDTLTGPDHPPVWVDTGLDIDWAVDPADQDHLTIEPTETLHAVHEAMTVLGFRADTSIIEAYARHMDYDGHPLDFSYEPAADTTADVNRVDIEFGGYTDDGLEVSIIVDREAFDLTSDDIEARTRITDTNPEAIANDLRTIIQPDAEE